MKRIISAVILASCLFACGMAQRREPEDLGEPGSITGTVLDCDGKLIVNARLRTRERFAFSTSLLNYVYTDQNGRFLIPHLRYGSFDLLVSAPEDQRSPLKEHIAPVRINPSQPSKRVRLTVPRNKNQTCTFALSVQK
jgi:hypothetical protein